MALTDSTPLSVAAPWIRFSTGAPVGPAGPFGPASAAEASARLAALNGATQPRDPNSVAPTAASSRGNWCLAVGGGLVVVITALMLVIH
ncbi:hypothetical protein [Subtercola sp. YIM 133946]|uniref:hypothetical protein n=1 Tax=Subtercola sp. YIM 133946 TaxID=3118909 RepID=UPI002F959BFB